MSSSLALNIADAGDEGVNQALNTLSWSIDALNALLVGGFIGAATVGLTRAAIVPRWFTWFGLAAAVSSRCAGRRGRRTASGLRAAATCMCC